jgi:ABC-type sugar transport system ATPase subunit
MASITLSGVGKAYPGKSGTHILQNIDFSIGDGEFVVLVGPSGLRQVDRAAHDRGPGRDQRR